VWQSSLLLLSVLPVAAQEAPPTPDKAWNLSLSPAPAARNALTSTARPALDPNHVYTLPELVDVAEANNPETRALWERAKQKAAQAGVERSALFPTVAAVASASVNQYPLFFGKFYHENTAVFPAIVSLSYSVFDAGSRRARILEAQANLLEADFLFNDAHRKIIFRVTDAYYRLLDAMSQQGAAQATLQDAQTVQEAVDARYANGLATLPEVLEARAATAQARYEIASIQGLQKIARGGLATALGGSPTSEFRIQDVSNESIPAGIEEPIETVLERAVARRPDLLAQLALVQSADAEIKKARSAFYPEISFFGDWGHSNSFGEQKNYGSSAQGAIYPYQAQVNIRWNVFDGGARRNALVSAQAGLKEAQEQAALSRDQIENEVWTAYTNLKTAQEQHEAATALLEAERESYEAASESFRLGVGTFIDVTAAQRELARARSALASARIQLLSSFATFAFRAGDPIRAAQH
jgi:outer membrane protein TolC